MCESRPAGSVEELCGTWKLISWTRRLLDTGETVEAFGKMPRALLNDSQRAELYNTMVAYAGRYTFDGNAATHHVEVSWNEVWTGTAQVRNLRFEGKRLVMSTNPQPGVDGRRSTSVFVWERA